MVRTFCRQAGVQAVRQPSLSRYAIEAKAFVNFLPHAVDVELSKHGLEEGVQRSSVVGATRISRTLHRCLRAR
jgi:hypothetical protein